jgi:Xaa-Pro aminopeptidase
MEAAGIDILLVPDAVNSRYLTQMAYDIGPTIVPLTGEVTALTNRGRVGSAARAWVRDLREWNRHWTAGMIDRLNELDADRKIIGVDGLDGLMRSPAGNLNYLTFIALREAFPHTRWVGASYLLQEVRYIKSDEEIDVLAHAAAGADAGLLAMVAATSPGVTDRELWGQMALAMLRAGCDPPEFAHMRVASFTDTREMPVQPSGRVVHANDLLVNTVDGLYCGYAAQGVQPIAVGPVSDAWREAWSLHLEAWDRTWDALRPGATFADVVDAVAAVGRGRYRVRQTLHGQGLGDDIPLITPSATRENRMPERALEAGVCFVLKPYATWEDASGRHELNWGDTVVITDDGARRLGNRPHEIIVRD